MTDFHARVVAMRHAGWRVWRRGNCVSIRPPKRRGPQRTRVLTRRAFVALAAQTATGA